jgi:hypothetical protein
MESPKHLCTKASRKLVPELRSPNTVNLAIFPILDRGFVTSDDGGIAAVATVLAPTRVLVSGEDVDSKDFFVKGFVIISSDSDMEIVCGEVYGCGATVSVFDGKDGKDCGDDGLFIKGFIITSSCAGAVIFTLPAAANVDLVAVP